MKKLMNKYRYSKFKRCANGLLFALISTISLAHCLSELMDKKSASAGTVLPFIIAIVSLLIGLVSLFRENDIKI